MSKDNEISKEIQKLSVEIDSINSKIDIILEILDSFTIMLEEEDEESEDYSSEWIPEQEENWNSYDDDELDG